MNLRGIGGHTTSLVALSEFTPIILASGEDTQIHFFIAKLSVHTVLGRPFLADNNIRLEFSHKQGEILSYQEPDGRRLCMQICKPQTLGWQMVQLEEWIYEIWQNWSEIPQERSIKMQKETIP
ncbi:hypothetical protein O181_072903 [Austropuccinia psidii MF-1]|uniref:Uncharacterized protein n=1 Tax=Austropuccinia psidii MF-1 TaxID=1389203 RepID=A0A9Q3F859_9BASI|nr:hypothetical protein [Austropuccinia psidii MF-1]